MPHHVIATFEKDGQRRDAYTPAEAVSLKSKGWTQVGHSLLTETGPTPPPMGGEGSGADAWHAYAEMVGVETDHLDSRDDIVTAIHQAGQPTDR